MKPIVSMRDALADKRLLGSMVDGPSWDTWKALLIASRGEPLTEAELALYKARTAREAAPDEPVDEMWLIAGRRSGKTAGSSTLAIYLAALCDWSDCLSRGERGSMLFLAQSQRTAKVAFRYAQAAFEATPALKKLVTNITQDTIELKTGIDLEIRSASFRGLRGITCVGVLADEIAYWFSDETSSNPDSEILAALRPSLATTGGPLIAISSPYGRKGEMWETYRKHYGDHGDAGILVAQGASRDFNQTLPQKVVDRALERDPDKARAEYLGLFREDVSTFVVDEAVRRCIEPGIIERAPKLEHPYVAFVDPSGGSSDSFTLGIAHPEGDTAVLDAFREVKPPFNPEAVVAEFCSLMRSYRISQVHGDRYGGEWVADAFSRQGIHYEPSEKSKSQIYIDMLPLINSQSTLLLDSDRLVRQLTGLERRTTRGGRDSVDHGPGGHDDLSNSVAGAVVLAAADCPTYTKSAAYTRMQPETQWVV